LIPNGVGTASVERDVVRDDVVDALLAMGVSPSVLGDFPDLPADVEGLLVYGSQARGDVVPGSDLDVLALVTAFRPELVKWSV
jgi:UTP:GlnB (protein PII) uridylyltransferase